jgi:L-alanine-DL-glutamate epimerase-like enolase superfamily enzyme
VSVAAGRVAAAEEAPRLTDATIAAVEATPFRLRYASAISLSDGVRETADQVLVTVTTSDGIVGYAECIPRPGIYGETVQTACTLIEGFLASRVIGIRVSDLQMLADKLGALRANPAARSSIELAVLDALARTLGLPAHRLLGGAADHVPCAAILAYGPPDEVVAEARALRDGDGIRMFKLKVGADALHDAELAQALRAELGESVMLYADANGRYSEPDAALFLRRTADCRLWGLEEPIDASDLRGRARLAASAPALVIGDESCIDPRDTAAELIAGRSTAVSIKLARTGIIGSTRIREHCAALGVPVAVGTQADSAIGAYAAAAFAGASPWTARGPAELLFFRGFANNPVRQLPEIRDGSLWLPTGPGFGFDIDQDALAEGARR